MLKPSLTSIMVALFLGLGTAQAHEFTIEGAGNQIRIHALVGTEQVQPGGKVIVDIINGDPGYRQPFIVYLAGKDASGNDVILDYAFIQIPEGSSGTVILLNPSSSTVVADDLAVIARAGSKGSQATASHNTLNP